MIEVCLRNGQVQQKWSSIAKDVIGPETSNILLKEIITLWITIRDFPLQLHGWNCTRKEQKRHKKEQEMRKMLTLKQFK